MLLVITDKDGTLVVALGRLEVKDKFLSHVGFYISLLLQHFGTIQITIIVEILHQVGYYLSAIGFVRQVSDSWFCYQFILINGALGQLQACWLLGRLIDGHLRLIYWITAICVLREPYIVLTSRFWCEYQVIVGCLVLLHQKGCKALKRALIGGLAGKEVHNAGQFIGLILNRNLHLLF